MSPATEAAVETDVPGDPRSFHDLAAHLRHALARRVSDLSDTAAHHRSALATSWQGAAGEAFGVRAEALTQAGDAVQVGVEGCAAETTRLGDVLDSVHAAMAEVRAEAAAAGLDVDGTSIRWPADAPPYAWTRLQSRVRHTTGSPDDERAYLLADAFARAEEAAEAERQRWHDAVAAAAEVFATRSSDLFSVTSSLVSAGMEAGLRCKLARTMTAESAHQAAEAERLRARARELAGPTGRIDHAADRLLLDQLMDDSREARYAAIAAEQAAADPHLPGAVKGGLGTLGPLAAAYGVVTDIRAGESPAQAVVSQAAGAVASAAGAALAGAAAGSVAPGPGTLAGALVVGGASLAGSVAGGLLGNGAVDHVWKNDDDAGEAILGEAELAAPEGRQR